jgi:transcriptional regulator with XRE-family HTH domain
MTFDYPVNLHLTHESASVYGAWMTEKQPPKPAADPARLGIGQKLKAAREAKGLTQTEVADKFGVKKATVSAWETGAGAPDAMRLRSLARLYDVSADALLWDDSLTPEAMKFAAQFDALTDKQRRSFKVMWMAYFEDALSDEGVEAEIPITKERRRSANEIDDKTPPPTIQNRRKTDHR